MLNTCLIFYDLVQLCWFRYRFSYKKSTSKLTPRVLKFTHFFVYPFGFGRFFALLSFMNSTNFFLTEKLNSYTFTFFGHWSNLKSSSTVLWSLYQPWIMVRHKWMANVKTVFKLSLAQTLPLWPGCPGAGIVNSVMFFHFASCSLIHAGGVINFIVASPFLRLIDPMFDFPGIMYPLCCWGGRGKK